MTNTWNGEGFFSVGWTANAFRSVVLPKTAGYGVALTFILERSFIFSLCKLDVSGYRNNGSRCDQVLATPVFIYRLKGPRVHPPTILFKDTSHFERAYTNIIRIIGNTILKPWSEFYYRVHVSNDHGCSSSSLEFCNTRNRSLSQLRFRAKPCVYRNRPFYVYE